MKKRGQIWVETVIYILIGLTIFGGLLYVALPKINEYRDQAVLAQSKQSLSNLNDEIQSVLASPWNKREVSLKVLNGEYNIDPKNSTISFILKKTKLKYSEPGFSYNDGDITILTLDN